MVKCHNNTYKHVPLGINFHTFPKDPVRRDLWVRAVKRAVPGKPGALWQPKSHHLVCSEHFAGGKKSDDEKSPSYVPSIFPTHTVPGPSEESAARARRLQARSGGAQGPPRKKRKVLFDAGAHTSSSEDEDQQKGLITFFAH